MEDGCVVNVMLSTIVQRWSGCVCDSVEDGCVVNVMLSTTVQRWCGCVCDNVEDGCVVMYRGGLCV